MLHQGMTRSLLLLTFLSIITISSMPAQLNYWQERGPAVGYNVGINPLNPNTIYCERTSDVLSVSRDKGKHWTDLPTTPYINYGIRQILIHPNDTLSIFIAGFFNDGLWKTTDEGAHWHAVIPSYGIDGESFDFDPSHPDTMYAGKFSDGSVYRSTDRGETWTLQGISGPELCGLIVRPDSANILYAGTGSSTISKSTDAGVTWRMVNNGGTQEVPKFAINPLHPLIGYAATYGTPDTVNNLWKTTDGGETWFKTPLQKIAIWSMAIDVQHPETLYVGRFSFTSGMVGIERTTDGGATFQNFTAGLPSNFAAWNLRVHPLSPNDVWVAGANGVWGPPGGVYRLIDSSSGFISGKVFLDNNANGIADSSEPGVAGRKIYAVGAIAESTYTDVNGNYLFPNLLQDNYSISEALPKGWLQTFPSFLSYSVTLSPGGDSTGFNFGNYHLYPDAIIPGWNMVSVPVTAPDFHAATLFPTASSNAFSYAGSYIVQSILDTGTGYWLKFPNADTIYIAGLPKFRCADTVRTGWNIIGSVAKPIAISSITSIPGGIITSQFFGYDGSYYTTDMIFPGRAYWVKVHQAGNLILDGSGGGAEQPINIMATSERPPLPPNTEATNKTSLPSSFALGQSYPNPFNPTTRIDYQLPLDSRVSLKIYNLAGQVVSVLRDDMEDAGYKSVEWNAGSFASGVYFYKLEITNTIDPTKSFTQVRKMALVK